MTDLPDSTEPPPTDPGEPTPSEFTAVCQTETCPVFGVPFDVWLYPNPPDPGPVWSCVCGRCGQPDSLTPGAPPAA